MTRFFRALTVLAAAILIAGVASACGTDKIAVPASDTTQKADKSAADIFNQRCGGCHTLAVAGTDGSGKNPRTYLNISGPNFDIRCESPQRVLYAIENGGFGGGNMPQNVVVGSDARKVASFVSKFSGKQRPAGSTCDKSGALPPPATP
ncbi:MAG: hypothetical protein J2O48_13120 [Solirubrobacterales bacterium]|nr:hypothetical protein [Solirubrobacterales bacterium]